MTIDRVEITPELYARYKAMAAGDLNRYKRYGSRKRREGRRYRWM